VDFIDVFWRGKWSLRKVLLFVKRLPRTSRFARYMNPSDEWTIGEHLQAATVDLLARAVYVLQATNVSEQDRARLEVPKPLPRPGVEPEVEVIEFATISEARAALSDVGR